MAGVSLICRSAADLSDEWGQSPMSVSFTSSQGVRMSSRGYLRSASPDRLSAGIAAVWSVAVAIALVLTLNSLSTDDFDGLNNMLQIPFALPWFLLPIGGIWSHEVDAWIAAAMGWFIALLILLLLPEWRRRHQRA